MGFSIKSIRIVAVLVPYRGRIEVIRNLLFYRNLDVPKTKLLYILDCLNVQSK